MMADDVLELRDPDCPERTLRGRIQKQSKEYAAAFFYNGTNNYPELGKHGIQSALEKLIRNSIDAALRAQAKEMRKEK